MKRTGRIHIVMLFGVSGLLTGAAVAQIAAEAVPARHFTWDELVAQQRAAPPPPVAVPFSAPYPGRVQNHYVPSPSLETRAPGGEALVPFAPEALCPGFTAWPDHSGTFGFQGLGDNNTVIPPDTMGAVGPRHVMTMLNSQVRIANRNGAVDYSTVSLATFWAGLTGPFDPRLYYDNLSARWIAVCDGSGASASSAWEVAISDTDDPTGGWTSYHFDGDAANTRWVDFPCVGFNDKWVAVTFNAFAVPGVSPAPATGAKMWVVNKPQLLAGGTVGFVEYDVGFLTDFGFSLQPAVCMEPGVDDLYILDSSGWIGDPGGDTNWLRMSRITGTAEAPQWAPVPGSNTVLEGFFPVDIRFSNDLQPGLQSGSSTALDAGDSRMQNVVYRNGHIWAVHAAGWPADSPDRNAILWYELQPSLPNPIVQSGVIETGGPGGGYMYPSVAVNCGNDVCIGFSSTSAAIYASACYVTRLAGDPPGTTSPTQYFKDGRAKYVKLDNNTPPRNRWGDYSATVIDPLDDKTFWTLQEYADLPRLGSDRWAVQWAQITQDCQSPGISQDPVSQGICPGDPVTFTVDATGDVADYQWSKDGQPIVGETFYSYTIPAVSEGNAGQYSCTVIGLCSAVTSDPATLEILAAPVVTGFVAWPQATCPGDNASIIPAVPDSGSPPISITLQKYDGAIWQDVPGRTISLGDTFDFTPLASDDTGDYRLEYGNACGTAYTDSHRLQVGVSFDQQPADATQNPCESASFSVQARGLGALSYQWRQNGVDLADNDRVSGAQTAALTVSGLRYADEGLYDCVVTDDCGPYASAAATLALVTPPWVETPMNAAPNIATPATDPWTMAFDARRGVMVLYGGLDVRGYPTNHLWEYDGIEWTARQDGSNGTLLNTGQALFDNQWPPSQFVLVFDPDDGLMYLIGENGWQWPMAIWTWNGNSWAQPYYGPATGGHQSYRAVYDRARHRIVIIRAVGSGYQTELLEYDPSTNTLTGPTPLQPPLEAGAYNARLVYDEARSVCIWYQNDGVGFGPPTTWAYDGTTWTKLTGDSVAFGAGQLWEYDPVLHQTTTMGGPWIDSNGYYTGTWAFPAAGRWSTNLPAASDWELLLPDGPPRNPAAAGISPDNAWTVRTMAFDQRRRATVALGYYWPDNPSLAWRDYERRYLDEIVFDRPPHYQPLVPGATETFDVVAAGYGTLDYQWQRDGVDISDGPAPGGGTLTGTNSPTLTITNVGAQDGGLYACFVSNSCGGAASTPALLGTPAEGDLNGDGVIDIADYRVFADCMTGANVAYPTGCGPADFDRDDDVDLADFATFQELFTHAGL